MKKQLFMLVSALCVFSSCENVLSQGNKSEETLDGNLIVNVFQLEQTPFSSVTRTDPANVCTRLNFAVYDADGERVKQINQEVGDADFGSASFQLPEDTYLLVVLAHSSNGNPTMTDPTKIKFTNAQGYTDTFLYSNEITVESEPLELSLTLNRIVSLCRFIITDDYPEGVAKMQFQYKGGSGAFDANTGLGSVNSTQTLTFDVKSGQKQFDLYTFLHDTEGAISLVVTALDANGNLLYEQKFDIPLFQNQITWVSGDFFGDGGSQTVSPTITIDTQWNAENFYTY
ncbi:MAG: FimB/Mfa2 family fimbrial subunit [Bacteroidaceae bacterium]|nr:FimB/Mfa2 family fimbrial subunit [Bacteroidaceae bacterium]